MTRPRQRQRGAMTNREREREWVCREAFMAQVKGPVFKKRKR
jgi:hypothetical protein